MKKSQSSGAQELSNKKNASAVIYFRAGLKDRSQTLRQWKKIMKSRVPIIAQYSYLLGVALPLLKIQICTHNYKIQIIGRLELLVFG